ncbi:hypothetical protein [Streptomyces sp. KS 21]|uniref:Uncharacterized protein n=1 Tax=Streptomyces sp. R33 TaxID=3238629 RepID=A0AB39YDU7_9ACTN|nr:hypothetical protein [Streptomyces sp. KS 21]TDU79425.1 hypothetical protein EDD91_6235 [Streptomyces sp. KS 21]
MSRYAFPAAPSAVADAPKAAAFLFEAFEAFKAPETLAVLEATAFAAFDGARS